MEAWQNPHTIVLWIIIAVVFFLLLLAFIVLLVRAFYQKMVKTKLAESAAELAHQQHLLDTTITTQEKERKRIAADIHDALIGKLTAVKLLQEAHPTQYKESIGLIHECIGTARRISHNLSPPLLAFTSVTDLIKEVLEPWENTIQIDYLFDVRIQEGLNNEFKIQLIRIIQELVTNIGKHANATTVQLHFRQSEDATVLQIKDNGIGFDLTNNTKGSGLKNIETRVQYLKGKYQLRSRSGHGISALFIFHNLPKAIQYA